jgi:hypothetical protein
MAAIVTRLINCTKSSVWIKMVSAHGIYVKLNSVLAIESLFKIISLILAVITTFSVRQRLSQICKNLDVNLRGTEGVHCFSVLFFFYMYGWLINYGGLHMSVMSVAWTCTFFWYSAQTCVVLSAYISWDGVSSFISGERKRSIQMPPIWSVWPMLQWHLLVLILANA